MVDNSRNYVVKKDENVSSTWVKAQLGILLKGELAKAGKLFLGRQLFCSEQKCRTLYTALCSLINSPKIGLDKIKVKFSEARTYVHER